MAPDRPFITCHVLDTTTGKPAAGIAVSLRLLSPSSTTSSGPPTWSSETNADGRVTAWAPNSSSSSSDDDDDDDLNAVVARTKASLDGGEAASTTMTWALTFETEAYFGQGQTFWPQVELRFAARVGEAHYHVPLLLAPWSYTTYRGS